MNGNIFPLQVSRVEGGRLKQGKEVLAVEEPLEIRLEYHRGGVKTRKTISITMRTPGQDLELAAGFLFTEGLISRARDIAELRHCAPAAPHAGRENVVRVELKPGVDFDEKKMERHFYTTSSCGVCGKTSIEALRVQNEFCSSADAAGARKTGPGVRAEVIHRLPDRMKASQRVFESTGGLHASALFSAPGELLLAREDVGRHNALDKLIGAALLSGQIPLTGRILMVSGRASFELVQKAAMAGIPVLAAVGAPSSLAVELAREMDMTLLGFVRDQRFNIYCGQRRIQHGSGKTNEASNPREFHPA